MHISDADTTQIVRIDLLLSKYIKMKQQCHQYENRFSPVSTFFDVIYKFHFLMLILKSVGQSQTALMWT